MAVELWPPISLEELKKAEDEDLVRRESPVLLFIIITLAGE